MQKMTQLWNGGVAPNAGAAPAGVYTFRATH